MIDYIAFFMARSQITYFSSSVNVEEDLNQGARFTFFPSFLIITYGMGWVSGFGVENSFFTAFFRDLFFLVFFQSYGFN